MAKCSSCGKMKCSCGGMAHKKKMMMGGMAKKGGSRMKAAIEAARAARQARRGRGAPEITTPGFPVNPPPKDMEKMPIARPGSRSGMVRPGFARGRRMMAKGGAVRRKGTCGKNS